MRLVVLAGEQCKKPITFIREGLETTENVVVLCAEKGCVHGSSKLERLYKVFDECGSAVSWFGLGERDTWVARIDLRGCIFRADWATKLWEHPLAAQTDDEELLLSWCLWYRGIRILRPRATDENVITYLKRVDVPHVFAETGYADFELAWVD